VGLDASTGALAALRLAPIQAACCGHPVTTGLDSIDHFLSGKLLEPPGAQVQYREKLVRLAGLGSAPRAPAAPGAGDWADALRIDGKPLLMCLQNLAKLPPSFDAVIAAILARSSARLVLFDRGDGASTRWRKRIDRALVAHGVAQDMLRFEPLRDYPDFLAGIARADLILDSPGFSGGATSLDALAMGAVVLCFEGGSARARQTSAMMRVIEVPELIASSAADYVERAAALLAEPRRLETLRSTLRERADRLFDGAACVETFAAFLRSCEGR
jgi:protein O-GlcNAc transferase